MKTCAAYRFLFIVLLAMTGGSLYSQGLRLEMGSGVGFYRMSDLKDLNVYIKDGLPFRAENTADFPPYFYYRGAVSTQLDSYRLGLSLAFHSTGSRISSMDYSGEYRFDNLIKCWMPGVWISTPLLRSRWFWVEGKFEAGAVFSKLNLIEFLQLDNVMYINSNDSFEGLNSYFEPSLEVSAPVWKFMLGVHAGYMVQNASRGFYMNGNRKMLVTNPATGNGLKPEWGGARLSLTLSYNLHAHRQEASTGNSGEQ